MIKALIVLATCIVIGYFWSKSHRNRRMLPIALAFLPALDAWIVQSALIQQFWATHLQGMTASAGGCQVGLGDFAIGGIVIGSVIGSGIVVAGILITTFLVAMFSWVGMRIALESPGTLVPVTIFPVLGGIPAFMARWREHWMTTPPSKVADSKTFLGEVKMMRVLCPLFALAVIAGWISLFIHS